MLDTGFYQSSSSAKETYCSGMHRSYTVNVECSISRYVIEGSIVKIGFMSHMGWVPSVSWSPLNENLFISGSYDMLMKMWDIRRYIPLWFTRAAKYR